MSLMNSLTVKQSARLKELIGIVKETEAQFIRCGTALAEIHDHKLWTGESPTFKHFCETTFGWSIRRAEQIIKASKTLLELPEQTRTMVRSERAARALSEAPKEVHATVIEIVASTGPVTAKNVKAEVDKLKEEYKILDSNGREVPKPALPYWNRRDEPQEIARTISSARSAVRKLQDTSDKLYCEVNMNEVLASLSKAYTEFKQAIPAAVCGMCQGKVPKGCTFCKGRGVTSKFRFDTCLPEELKKKK